MKKMLKRSVSMMLVVLMLFAVLAIPAEAAAYKRYWTITGRIPTSGYTSGQDVYTNGSKAKLRICTVNQAGNRKSGNITVLAVGDNGQRYTWNVTGCNGISENTTNITLPAGNTQYKVYIKRNGNSNTNKTICYYFSIDFKSNCWWYG